MSPVFLDLSDVVKIHQDQIEKYGGDQGIRDAPLLESAIAMPMAGFGGRFLHDDLFEMAAAYLFHITRNHPFMDANKRTGTAAALVFLELNNIEVNVSQEALVEMVLAVAEGKAEKTAITEFFRKNSRKSRS